MVKVSIRDYMPPCTSWMQVELEDGVCNGSPELRNPEGSTGEIQDQGVSTTYEDAFEDQTWKKE